MRFEEVPIAAGEAPPAQLIRRAVAALRAGRVLAHPTSTLYGLGARVTPELDRLLARLKGRPSGKPFIRLAASASVARGAVPPSAWPERAERLGARFWPGALTLVVDDGTSEGIALRVDSHPAVLALLAALGELLSSTSLNRVGAPPANSPAEVRSALQRLPTCAQPALFLEAGTVSGVPSTLLCLREDPPRLLRAGAVPVEEIEACLEEEVQR